MNIFKKSIIIAYLAFIVILIVVPGVDLDDPISHFDRLIPELKKDSAVINDLFRRCYDAELKYRKTILYGDRLIHVAGEPQYSYIRKKYGFDSVDIGVGDDSAVYIGLPDRMAICYSVSNPIKYDTTQNAKRKTKLVYPRCWIEYNYVF